MSQYARYLALAIFGVAVVVVGSARTVSFVLELRHTDQAQDARIDELEQQLRDLRASDTAAAAAAPPAQPPFASDDSRVHGIPIGTSPVRGPSDAWVTIVAFTDYQCPFCGRVQQTLRELQERNPDVRVVVKHLPLPFHKLAHPAAVDAECAHEHGRFWQVHDALYGIANTNNGYYPNGGLDRFLADPPWEQLGLDANAMRTCIDGGAAARIVDEDAAFAAAIHASGTPTFYVNGRKLSGAQPLEQFQTAVDTARAAAKASGVPAADYYTKEIVAKNAP